MNKCINVFEYVIIIFKKIGYNERSILKFGINKCIFDGF